MGRWGSLGVSLSPARPGDEGGSISAADCLPARPSRAPPSCLRTRPGCPLLPVPLVRGFLLPSFLNVHSSAFDSLWPGKEASRLWAKSRALLTGSAGVLFSPFPAQ